MSYKININIPGKLKLFLFAFYFLYSAGLSLAAEDEKSPVRIGIVMDSQSPELENTREVFCKEVQDLLDQEFEVSFSEPDQYLGDWTADGIKRAVNDALYDSKIDVIVGIGVMSSNEISQRKVLSKPSFAPFIMNIDLQGLKENEGTSGVKNLNYLTFPTNLARDFSVFKKFYPFDVLTVLVNGYVLRTIPDLEDAIHHFAEDAGIRVKILPVLNSADEIIGRLPSDTEAIYVISLTQLPDEEICKLADELIKRKIPGFSLFSKRYIPSGFMASMSPDTDLPRLLRRLALNIQRVLLGENPGDLDVHVTEVDQLLVNMKTVKEVGITPPWELLQDAVLFNSDYEEDKGIHLSLVDAVQYVLKENLELDASRKVVAIGCEDVNLAKSNLLPQVEVGAALVRIDRDRAKGSFGILPEKAGWGRASVSQMVYSNQAIGNYRVEKRLQCARKHEYCAQRLDNVLQISRAYLNLLRAKTIESIHRNNLERTRSHLKLARQRVQVGAARLSEVYRWESQYANDLTKVTTSNYQTKGEKTSFKRILNLPLTTKVQLDQVSLDEPYWVEKKDWIVENITNDRNLELFIDYSTLEGLSLSEEVKHLQQLICAQAQVLGIAKRSYWTPDIFLEAMVSDRFNEWGAGTKTKALFNSTDWTVALNVSFPLYTGGYKSAKKRQACQELKRLNLQLRALIEMKKEEIRNSTYKIISSYTVIALSQNAAETAGKNLKLVQDSYTKGVMPIVDLLDAQNQALIADLETANAIYDYLIDLMIFQRNIGRFDFLACNYEVKDWVEQIDYYFKVHLQGG